MVAFILPANSVRDTGYDIANSCRFDDGSSSTLEIDLAESANASRRTFTWSAWVKRSTINGVVQTLYSTGSGADDFDALAFDANDNLKIITRNAGSTSATLITNAKYRDVSAWYHIVMRIDTTQGTEAQRLRLYVNGEEPSLGTATYTTQNKNLLFNTTFDNSFIGCQKTNTTSLFFDGYIAEIHNVSAASLGPGSFGETNDNGVWIPKDCKDDLTYGTNGYYLEFKGTGTSADSSGIGADTSGNDQHFSLNNIAATDVTTDTPTNNFATMKVHGSPVVSGAVLAEGNLKCTTGTSGSGRDLGRIFISNILVSSGKWYWEAKMADEVFQIGLSAYQGSRLGSTTNNTRFLVLNANGTLADKADSSESADTYMAAVDATDIVQFALDMDSTPKVIYFGEGGSWGDGSGNTDESSPNSAVHISGGSHDILTDTTDNSGFIGVSFHSSGGGSTSTAEINFGNPSFAISSGNSDGAGFGNFEFAVPSGYFALCTKNLAQYG